MVIFRGPGVSEWENKIKTVQVKLIEKSKVTFSFENKPNFMHNHYCEVKGMRLNWRMRQKKEIYGTVSVADPETSDRGGQET